METSGSNRPDWVQANPARINAALNRALAKTSGGWFVIGASRNFRTTRSIRNPKGTTLGPFQTNINDVEFVLWRPRNGGSLYAAPASCPHMGANLATGRVLNDGLTCPWHGLTLRHEGKHGSWSPIPAFDDGVLIWLQPNPLQAGATSAPILAARPAVFLEGVIARRATCEPQDVIANRLDPWHGAHFHPYAFSRLKVTQETDDSIDMVVAYKVGPRFELEVTARFETPEPRTIVMTIIDGEGTGSVVETHATPLVTAAVGRSPRTAIVEATLATSNRPGFEHALKGAHMARPMIRFAANRLWKDDAAYAERRYLVRTS